MPWQQNPNTGDSYWVEEQQPAQQAPTSRSSSNQVPAFGGTVPTAQQPKPAAQQQSNPWAPPTGGAKNVSGDQPWWQQQAPQPSGHQKTTAPYGMDQTMPGVAEQNWQQNQQMWYNSPQLDWANKQLGQTEQPGFGESYNQANIGSFGAPGEGQQHWDAVSGKFNEIGQYNQPNLAAESYQRTVQNLPGSIQPTFDSAFDRASEKATGLANSQAAGRGAYGSSAALNGVNSVISDIEAARASKHGDFALADSANQRAWLDSAAGQGRSADLSGLGMFGANMQGLGQFSDMAFRAEGADLARDQFGANTAFGIQDAEQGRIGQGIDAALGIDNNWLSRLNSGQNAAGAAQGARDGRVQGAFDNTRSFQNDMTGFLSDQFNNVFGGDQAAFDQWIESQLGASQNAKNDAERDQERNMQGAQAVADFATGKKQSGG